MLQRWLAFYFSHRGRATRYDFNVSYALVALIGGILAGMVDYLIWGLDAFMGGYVFTFSNFWQILIIIPTFVVIARRLHDLDLPGWIQAVVYLIPVVVMIALTGGTVSMVDVLLTPNGQYGLLQLLFVYLLFFIFISSKRGTVGPNKYGADPLEGKNV